VFDLDTDFEESERLTTGPISNYRAGIKFPMLVCILGTRNRFLTFGVQHF